MQTKTGHDWKIQKLFLDSECKALLNDGKIFLMTRKTHDLGLGEVREEEGVEAIIVYGTIPVEMLAPPQAPSRENQNRQRRPSNLSSEDKDLQDQAENPKPPKCGRRDHEGCWRTRCLVVSVVPPTSKR